MDNTKPQRKLWFKAKSFGWGWYPVSWEGWSVMVLYFLAIIPTALRIDNEEHSASDFLINFALYFILLTVLLLIICYITGEKPEWRWGIKKDTKTK